MSDPTDGWPAGDWPSHELPSGEWASEDWPAEDWPSGGWQADDRLGEGWPAIAPGASQSAYFTASGSTVKPTGCMFNSQNCDG
jgi:hypothetical protein